MAKLFAKKVPKKCSMNSKSAQIVTIPPEFEHDAIRLITENMKINRFIFYLLDRIIASFFSNTAEGDLFAFGQLLEIALGGT